MASILTDLVKPYVEKLINGAITESSYICCFTCIAKDFEDEKAKLEVERTTFNQQVDIATRGGEDVQANALFWEEQAVDLIQEDTKTKQKCFFGFCCNCIWRYRRGKELANKKEQIKKLIETRKELTIGLPAHLPDVERYSSQHYIPFKSRESKCKELLDALNDDNNYIVGLHGMGGTGKTTLAKEVGKKLKQSKQFTQVVDTTVSFSPDIKKIQDDIAGPLGISKFDKCNESDRPKKLWSRLTNGEKILLILDDVWGDINFNEIGIPYSDNRKGCSVLVTTRNLSVCNRIGCSSTIQLDLLSEDDAWIMFQRHAGLSEASIKDLLDKGRKIANECKRLPIAIAAIGSSLKGKKYREEWDVALNSLQKHMPVDGVDNDLADIYKCLKFSYDHLKNKNAEELFLLSSVFQEDEEISSEILTRLGIGAGLFGERNDKYNNTRNLVVVAKNKLLDSCLLLKTNKGDVKMHDLIREVAQWIANKDQTQVVNFSNKNQKSLVGRDNNIKYLLFDGNPKDLFSFRFDGSKLMILIFNMGRGCFEDVPVSFFENIAGLRVLNLIAKCQTISLPPSIRSLRNILSLLVERAKLGDISVLESLQSLETLDLKHCNMDKLPEEIAQLRELRLLNLEDCTIESNNPFEVIQRCQSLEELYFCRSFNDFCQEITLPTLERYHLTDSYHMIYDSSLSKCMCLENDYLSKATFKHVMQTSEHVSLERIKKEWKNLMPEIVPIDQGMNDLIELHLNDVSQLQCLVDTEHISSQVPNVFSKLVVLELNQMNNLEEFCNGPISLDSMDSLEELTIMYCGNLRSLFKGNVNLCNLKTVKIERCSKLVSVLSPSGSLPLLEELNISNCDHLETIFSYERRVDDAIEEILIPKLKVIKIESCHKLTYIFDQEVKLASLLELELFDVPNFIDIFLQPLSIKGSSNSISKPIKSNTFFCCYRSKSTKVPSVVSKDQPQPCSICTETSSYCLNIWERAQCLSRLSHILCNIKEIKLWNLSKIKSVFMLSIAPKMSLESLTIEECDELEHVVVDIGYGSGGNELGNVFPKLKELNVEDCEKLQYIFGHINASDDHDQDNIEIQLHIPALKSLMFVKLQSLISMCPKQYQTTFPALEKIELNECSQVDVKSIGDFTFLTSISRYLGSTTIKQFSGNIEHFLALERLEVSKSNVESILCLNEESERQINLGLQNMILRKLPMMIYLFVGPKNAFTLKNLKSIVIFGCKKLEIVFSTSVLRSLSQLSILRIEECNELKHIIEDDDDDIENQRMSNVMSSKTCFPVLKALAVVKCNKLKSVFPITMSKELPKLEAMIISEADELEEIFKSVGDDQKVKIPNLKFVGFDNLPSLFHVHGIFQTVENRFVQNCKKLSLTSLRSSRDIWKDLQHLRDGIDDDTYSDLRRLCQKLQEMPKGSDFEELCNEIPQGIQVSVEEGTASTSYANTITSSTHLESEYGNGQIDKTFPVSATECLNIEDVNLGGSHETTQTNNQVSLNDEALMQVSSTIEQQFLKDDEIIVSGLGMPSAINSPPNSHKLMNEQSMHQQRLKNQESPLGEIDATIKPSQGIKISVEDGTTSANANTITSTHLELVSSSHEQDVDVRDSQKTTKTNIDQVSLNDGAFMKVSSIIEQQFPKDDPSPSNNLSFPFSFQTHSMPFHGNPSQKVEDSSSPSLITCELEQLVSKKILAIENLSLLTDFLVKHPSVLLRDTSLSNRYKGYAYNCLSELLKFLQTHSVLDVLGSSHSEFVELLKDARRFPFDKDWLDSVEKCSMFPGLQVSQAALQKLLDSKHILTQHVKDLKHQLASSEAVLESIIQQEAQILETLAALSDPIGY
ncbi:Serine/threonine-protein kinase wnk4 [Trifolium repens]|nr:Serine/threonine-protein kinase wnk4 [Trifolium repens]